MRITKISNMEKTDKRKLLVCIFVIGFICIGSVTAYYLIAGETGGTGVTGVTGGTGVDISFNKWIYSNIRPNIRYIEDKGDYIEIRNSYSTWSTLCSAELSFNPSTEVTWKFKIKNLDTSSAKFYLRSGNNNLVQICGFQYTGRLMLYVRGFTGIVMLSSNDRAWHDIEINCKIDGVEADVTVKIDGVLKFDSVFGYTESTLDNLYYTSAQYYTTFDKTITHLILNSLIVK